MHGNNNFTKKDPLVNAVAKVMQENETRRQIEKQFQEEIGIQAKRELPFQKHAEYDRLLAERTAVALNEELKGNQHKIDANKNNKVDAQDFKILKAQKKQPQGADFAAQRRKERVASNGRMDEADYPPGAGQDTAKDKDPDMMKGAPGEKDSTPKAAPMPPKRPANMEEEAEQIDELSKKTLGSYVKKASHDVATKSAATGRYAERANKEEDDRKKTGDYSGYRQGRKDNETADKMFGKSWKRRQGIAKAVDKMTKEETLAERNEENKGKKDAAVTSIGAKNKDEKHLGSKGTGIRNSIADKIRGREVTSGKDRLEEKAPPGDKYERMVKHIKSKYSKDGLSDKEKSIAYATAWKAKNKDSE
jgi:hypothetical protein